MSELTDEKPKCLTELHGRPLLQHQITSLSEAGIDEIGIVTGYRREKLEGFGLHEFHNARWDSTNMVSSLECASEWLEAGPCIVSYSDIFYRPSAPSALMATDADIAITYDPDWLEIWSRRFDDPLEDAETFRLDAANHVTEIGNRPRSLEEVEGQYMGLLRFSARGWTEIRRLRGLIEGTQRQKQHMTGLLGQVIAAGQVPVTAIPYRDGWGEIDTASDLASYE